VVEKNGEKQTIDLYRMTVTSIQGTVVLDLSSSNGFVELGASEELAARLCSPG
jgi:hypothetical protein